MTLSNELIVDANILFSFFNPNSLRFRVLEELLYRGVRLISPDFVIEELLNNKEKIKNSAKISEEKFNLAFSSLKNELEIIPEQGYKSFLAEAKKLSPHNNKKDDPYFALSLSLNKCPILSDEKAFKNQSMIKVFSTKELLELLSKI